MSRGGQVEQHLAFTRHDERLLAERVDDLLFHVRVVLIPRRAWLKTSGEIREAQLR